MKKTIRVQMTISNLPISTALPRFIIVGSVTSLMHLLIAFSLIFIFSSLILDQKLLGLLSNILAYLAASFFSYIFNTRWSFGSEYKALSFLRFYIVAFFGLLATFAIFSIASSFEIGPSVGTLIVVILLPPINFAIHFLWTYKTQAQQ